MNSPTNTLEPFTIRDFFVGFSMEICEMKNEERLIFKEETRDDFP